MLDVMPSFYNLQKAFETNFLSSYNDVKGKGRGGGG